MLALSPAGTIKASGNKEALARWQPVIVARKTEIVDVLAELTGLVETCGRAYKFTPAELDEALQAALRNPIEARNCFLAIVRKITAERPPTLRGESK
jgi:hypothetical protein